MQHLKSDEPSKMTHHICMDVDSFGLNLDTIGT